MEGARGAAMGVNLGQLLLHHAEVRPAAIALAAPDRATTWAELAGSSLRRAAALRDRGCAPGDRVVTALPDGPACFEMLFACALGGFVFVPLHPDTPPAEREAIAARTDARVLLHAPLPDPGEGPAPREAPELAAGGDDLLLILHTSGSTGRPKGVTLSHANIAFSVLNQILGWGLREGERTIAAAPLSHAGGIVALTLPSLQLGGTVHFPAERSPDALLALAARERVTVQFLPPHVWADAVGTGALERHDLGALRVGATGGRALPLDTVRTLRAAIPGFTDAYGLTEAASCSTLLGPDDVLERNGSIGRALPFTRARIVGDDGEELPRGETGELALSGPTVMRGYWDDEAETARALRDGWLHTGDIARMDDDGFLWIEGRRKEMIHTAAGKVLAPEVERVLERHEAVAECAVLAVAGADGHAERVGAVVVWRGNGDAEALRRHCAAHLPAHKVPDLVVVRDALPRTRSGKIAKHALAAELGAPR